MGVLTEWNFELRLGLGQWRLTCSSGQTERYHRQMYLQDFHSLRLSHRRTVPLQGLKGVLRHTYFSALLLAFCVQASFSEE